MSVETGGGTYVFLRKHCSSFLPVLPFKYKYQITAQYSTLDEKHAFVSLAMFDIQYLIKEWLDTRVILYPCINHILKQSMKMVTISVHQKWDRLVIYLHALVITSCCTRFNYICNLFLNGILEGASVSYGHFF